MSRKVVITGNRITNNGGAGVVLPLGQSAVLKGNHIEGNRGGDVVGGIPSERPGENDTAPVPPAIEEEK